MSAPDIYLLAIDPGCDESAWALLGRADGASDARLALRGGELPEVGKAKNERLLAYFPELVLGCPTGLVHVVIERVESYGMPVGKEVFETVRWAGRFEQLLVDADGWLPPRVDWMGRKEVKLHLCQSMKAKDSNIRQAVLDRLGPQGTKKKPGPTYGVSKDVWQAIGLALTYYDLKLKGGMPPAGR